MSGRKKVFLIINLSFFGDVLLTNSLCQNIKKHYPNSEIVFLVNKPFCEAAKNQYGVDDVLIFDKKGKHKGFWGLLKFIFTCKYKNKIDTSFVMYDNDRGNVIAWLLGAKQRIAGGQRITKIFVTHKHQDPYDLAHMQDINGHYIKTLTGNDAEIVPIKYNTNWQADSLACDMAAKYRNKKIIGLCCVSKNKEKDMPVETAIEIINHYKDNDTAVLLFGAGKDSEDYASELIKRGCNDFENLVNKTTITNMANIMKICNAIISVDTGTMHLACAVGAPITVVFYKPDMIAKWGPREFLYKCTIIDKDYDANNICARTNQLISNDAKSILNKN